MMCPSVSLEQSVELDGLNICYLVWFTFSICSGVRNRSAKNHNSYMELMFLLSSMIHPLYPMP